MEILTEIVSPLQFAIAFLCSVFIIFIYFKFSVFKSLFDPSVPVIFQVFFTGFILLFCSFLSIFDLISYVVLFVCIYIGSKSKITDKILLNEQDWINFAKFFLYISLLCNAYLLYKKGFILFQPNQERIKVEFYQGYGIFKRLNEIAITLIGLASIYLIKGGQKRLGILYIIFIIYLIFSLGTKAGLVLFLFLLGGILHFYPIKISKKRILQLLFFSSFSVFIMFNLIYEKDVFLRIYYRLVSFSDGPVYFYKADLFQRSNCDVSYLFDQLFTNLRFQPDLQYMGLGHFTIKNYFQLDEPLFGPNPQIIIESKVIFKSFFIFYMAFIGFLFGLARRFASTPFSFLFICMFVNPLLLDGQYAFTTLLTLMIMCFFLICYFYLRSVDQSNKSAQ